MIFRSIILLFVVACGAKCQYVTHYADEQCIKLYKEEFANFYLGSSTSPSSAVILKATRLPPYAQSKNCSVVLIPNVGHGVVLSIREVDFSYLPTYCSDYIEIYDDSLFSPIKQCGYYLSFSELRCYSKFGSMTFLYHTMDRGNAFTELGFTVIATAYSTAPCSRDEFRCSNNRCVWKGLKCDGHNNCGDNSDEKFSVCDDFSPSGNDILIISFGIVVGVVLVSSMLLFCLRLKRWRQEGTTLSPFRPEAALPPYHTVYPSGSGISQNPAGPSPGRLQGDGGISNPCYVANYPDAPPPYKP